MPLLIETPSSFICIDVFLFILGISLSCITANISICLLTLLLIFLWRCLVAVRRHREARNGSKCEDECSRSSICKPKHTLKGLEHMYVALGQPNYIYSDISMLEMFYTLYQDPNMVLAVMDTLPFACNIYEIRQREENSNVGFSAEEQKLANYMNCMNGLLTATLTYINNSISAGSIEDESAAKSARNTVLKIGGRLASFLS